MNLKPGWVDEIAKQFVADKAAPVPPVTGKKSMRQSKAHDLQCAANGTRKGGANTVRKLNRLLGKADE